YDLLEMMGGGAEAIQQAIENQKEENERKGGDGNDYNYLPTNDILPSPPVDWTRQDLLVEDRWFLPMSDQDIVGNGIAVSNIDRWVQQWEQFAEGKGQR